METRSRTRPLLPLALVLALPVLTLLAGSARAGEGRDYAYFFLQGRLSEPSRKAPMAGAEILLTSGDSTFQATTDPKGNFVFEKLPLATYQMHITTAEGKVIRSLEEVSFKVAGPRRYKARLGHGEEALPVIDARKEGVSIAVPKPAVRWKRFWKQFAIFAGGALVLAL